MKLQLTKTAKQELKRLEVKLEKINYDYNKFNRREKLLADAQLYVDAAYVNNNFKSLDNWCLRTGQGEFIDTYRMRVKKNIGKMIIEDIITIVD
jgi:hypothetical protein